MKQQQQKRWQPFVNRIDDQQEGRRTLMKRSLVTVAALALLALPAVAFADDTQIPPELNWNPTPPARETRDAMGIDSLTEFLVQRGLITPQEGSELTQTQFPLPAGQGDGGLSQRMNEYLTAPEGD
jgi:hypothetical protein